MNSLRRIVTSASESHYPSHKLANFPKSHVGESACLNVVPHPVRTVLEPTEFLDVKQIAKTLKNELACGGTHKDGIIELQGDHRKKIKEILVKLGFEEDSISE